jgi:hypothetical protein
MGSRLANRLTPEQGRRLLDHATPVTLRERHDQADSRSPSEYSKTGSRD